MVLFMGPGLFYFLWTQSVLKQYLAVAFFQLADSVFWQ
jgi:hypothetical protein